MLFENVAIAGLAHVEPPHRVTSEELCQRLAPILRRLRAPMSILEDLTGITARRWWDEGVRPSDAATMAGRLVLESTGIDPKRIGIMVNTSVSRDYLEPSTACFVHQNLGLPEECINYDVGNACLAFLNGMDIVGNMIERGQVDYGMVVNGESSRYIIEQTIQRMLAGETTMADLKVQFASLTLGSGAAAMILARRDLLEESHVYRGGVTLAATRHNRLCLGHEHEMITDSKNLLIEGLRLAQRTYEKARRKLGWAIHEMDAIVMHQISKVHTVKMAEMFGVDLSRVHRIFPEFGNIGPASVPMVLSRIAQEGKLNKGDRIALMGIGSGLNCTMAEVVW